MTWQAKFLHYLRAFLSVAQFGLQYALQYGAQYTARYTARYATHCTALSANKRHLFGFCIFLAIILMYFMARSTSPVTQEPPMVRPPVIVRLQPVKKTYQYNRVSMPCIPPNCYMDCLITYDSEEKNGTIDIQTLSTIQRQHLMIDIGNDSIVNSLINTLPPVKICYDYRPGSQSTSNNASNNLEYYPLSFGFNDHFLYETIPRQVLINRQIYTVEQMCLPKKSMDFAELIPGRFETYKFAFENELDYRRIYGIAYFAITIKKAGWDCNRHYEIISSGTMPYFDNLTVASNYTLAHLPKPLLYDAQKLAGVNRKNMSIDHSAFDKDQYYLLLHRLVYYAKHRLTTSKLVEYMLKVIKYPLNSTEKHSVLFISHYTSDYMKDFMLDGFARVFKENLHVFQPPKFLYDYPDSKRWSPEETAAYFGEPLYGSGFGFKLSLKEYYHLYLRDKKELANQTVMQEWIESKNLTLIVYGSIMRAGNLLSVVTKHYNRSRIVIIDGQDEGHMDGRIDFAKQGYYFCREIPEDCREKFI